MLTDTHKQTWRGELIGHPPYWPDLALGDSRPKPKKNTGVEEDFPQTMMWFTEGEQEALGMLQQRWKKNISVIKPDATGSRRNPLIY